ncbi:MAG: tetratricopeptide repeat protein [Calditrichaeota bacterium]|nr:tetratricopeptide repeat protein [Calditrichota bacterium]
MKKTAIFFVLLGAIFFIFCQHKETPDAILKEAESLERDILSCAEKISQCKNDYEKILITYPESEAAATACFKLARLNELFGHFKDAADYYQKLVQNYPESELCANGLYNLAHIYQTNLDRPNDAVEIFQQLRGLFPSNEKAVQSYLEQAKIFLTKKNPHSAISTYQEFLNAYPQQQLRDEIYFRIAEIYQFEIKDSTEAVKFYQKLTDKYPQSTWSDAAKTRIDDLKKGTLENEK